MYLTLGESDPTKRKQDARIAPDDFLGKDGAGKIGNLRRAWNSACREIGMGDGYKLDGKYFEKRGG